MSSGSARSGKQNLSKTLPVHVSAYDEQKMKKSATTTPGGSQGEAEGGSASGNDKKIAGKTGEEPGKTNQIPGKPAKEFDRQSPKPASGSAVMTDAVPGKALQIPAQERDKQSSDSASSCSVVPQPNKSSSSPNIKKKSKQDHEQKTHVGSADSEDESSRLKRLLHLPEEELIEKDKEVQKLQENMEQLKSKNGSLEAQIEQMKKDREDVQTVLNNQECKLVEQNSDFTQVLQKNRKLNEEKMDLEAKIKQKEEQFSRHVDKVYKDNKRKLDEVHEHYQREIRTRDNLLSDVKKERDDLKTRFSKLAGAKLTDQNADIADLSDPNRAMKVSERFGTLYDDEWTDAFEELKKKKIPVKDAIQVLLSILQECLTFCNKLKDQQMDSLNNVLLHPSQDVSKFVNEPRKNVGGFKEKPRISSKDEKGVRDLRRQIGVSETCIEEVKQVFVMETKSWDKKGFDKKHLDLCMPYIQKCAEVCWLMVLHDPPLYMKMDVKHGDKMDLNLYTVYSSSGDTIDYLVWPPLYNEMGGGLISKGAAECVKSIKKK